MPKPQLTKKRAKKVNLPAWAFKKIKPTSEEFQQGKKDGKSVNFASHVDLCHVKDSELAKHTGGEWCSKQTTSKDDSGNRAVFTEPRAAPSQLTAATFLDTIPRLPGLADEANDTVSASNAWTHVRSRQIIAIARKKCAHKRGRRPKQWTRLKNQWVFLERDLYGHPSAGLLWENKTRKSTNDNWLK